MIVNKKYIYIIILTITMALISPLKSSALTLQEAKDFDIRTENAITGEDLEKHIEKKTSKDSYLRGMGKAFESGSKASGINMSLAFAQMVSENGWGNDSNATTSLKNYNYGNITGKGTNGSYTLPGNGNQFASFKSMEDGLKAYYDLLQNYVNGNSPATATNKAGTVLNTIWKMAYVYAPPEENDTEKYVFTIATLMEEAGQPIKKGKLMNGTGVYEDMGKNSKGEDDKVGDLFNKYKFVSDPDNKKLVTTGVEDTGYINGIIDKFTRMSESFGKKGQIITFILGILLIAYTVVFTTLYIAFDGGMILRDTFLDFNKFLFVRDSKVDGMTKTKLVIRSVVIMCLVGLVMANAHLLVMSIILETFGKIMEIITSLLP